MWFLELLFYSIAVFAGLMCLVAQNPVTAVLYMVLVFAMAAICIMGAGAEFLGILLVIIYVGAIAILFLFVVMMLNLGRLENFRYQRHEFFVIPLAAGLMIFFMEICGEFISFADQPLTDYRDWLGLVEFRTNAEMLGTLLYTNYVHIFLLLSVILLLAMVASISLTLGAGSQRTPLAQDKFTQLDRTLRTAVQLRKL